MNRIASLVPSLTELVCELGLAGELVARTGFCVHPRELVRRIPKVGGTKSVNLAKLRALAPTHAILNVDENTRQVADEIAAFVPHSILTHPLAPLDNLALYRRFGEAFGRQRAAEALCARFAAAWERHVPPRPAARRVLYLIWKDPWMSVARDTYISRTLAAFGLQTLPAESAARYPRLALEEPWVSDAELILLASEPYRFTERHAAELSSRLGRPARLVDGEMTSWYGSRAIAGLAYLARLAASL